MSKVSTIPVKKDIQSKSYLKGMQTYLEMYERSLKDPDNFWLEAARGLDWFSFPDKGGDGDFGRVNYSWFSHGKINASYNCLDRHLEKNSSKTALIWAKDAPGEYQHMQICHHGQRGTERWKSDCFKGDC